MGEGNVRISEYLKKYVELCPGRAITLEIIVTQPRIFPYMNAQFWDGFRRTPAWEFARFVALAESGTPRLPGPPVPKEQAAAKEREDLEASARYMHKFLNS
jgi:hypothetical protein